eukprot:COSAG01_NODE_1990_length_8697_cov_5.164922_9_plen_67_part_00
MAVSRGGFLIPAVWARACREDCKGDEKQPQPDAHTVFDLFMKAAMDPATGPTQVHKSCRTNLSKPP